jgi:hypothetical protein
MRRFLQAAAALTNRTAESVRKAVQRILPSIRRILPSIRSIRFRLTVWSVLILAVILAAFSVFVFLRQARDIRLESLAALQIKSRQLMGIYRASDGLGPDRSQWTDPPESGQPGS